MYISGGLSVQSLINSWMCAGSTSGISASAGAEKGVPPYLRTRSATWSRARLSRMATVAFFMNALCAIRRGASYPARLTRSADVHRRRLAEVAVEQMIDQRPVLRARACVRNARHDDELLVGIREPGKKIGEILKRRDPVPLPAHDKRGHGDLFRIDDRQIRRHVDVGSRRHRFVQ